jgi:hypothetical protein
MEMNYYGSIPINKYRAIIVFEDAVCTAIVSCYP